MLSWDEGVGGLGAMSEDDHVSATRDNAVAGDGGRGCNCQYTSEVRIQYTLCTRGIPKGWEAKEWQNVRGQCNTYSTKEATERAITKYTSSSPRTAIGTAVRAWFL